MPQKSLSRSPVATPKKHTPWWPKWILTGTGNPKPVSSVPILISAPVASATSLSYASRGVLTCTPGNWYYSPSSYAVQWFSDASPIAGATSLTYALAASDPTHSLTCKVTPSNSKGAGTTATSNALAIVA